MKKKASGEYQKLGELGEVCIFSTEEVEDAFTDLFDMTRGTEEL